MLLVPEKMVAIRMVFFTYLKNFVHAFICLQWASIIIGFLRGIENMRKYDIDTKKDDVPKNSPQFRFSTENGSLKGLPSERETSLLAKESLSKAKLALFRPQGTASE